VWDALGQLTAVRQEDKSLARYTYSHRGERIGKTVQGHTTQYLYNDAGQVSAELNANGRITRQYLYLADQPIAVIDTPDGKTLSNQELLAQEPRGIEAKNTLKALWRNITASSPEQLAWLHTNHLGAPQAATGAGGQVLWQASYAAFGAARTVGVSGFTQNLRLPGQYFDAETGLHYNRHRYYDSSRGEYLTPDPLGTPDGPNPDAYVRYNPLKYVDPEGLILFAFDGTGNGENPTSEDSISNVRKLWMAYDQDVNGTAYYITGIGTTNADMTYQGNMANGDGFDQRVDLGFTFLEKFIDANSTATDAVQIDVVGFSRGAAEARVWMNQLVGKLIQGRYTSKAGKSRCLELRFEGLWDTVPHLGYFHGNEAAHNFAIPTQVKYAAHAVALNEHRGGMTDFDGRSILNAPATSSGGNRNEMGFIGSHADVGGGYGTGDLSDVALMWMIEQGKTQGIKFVGKTIADNGWDTVSNPILHDKSANKLDPIPLPTYGDRDFVYGNGSKVKQAAAVIGGNDTTWAKTMVSYYLPWCGPSSAPATGVVDMAKYSAWLSGQGVNMAFTAPSTPHPCF
jgi:RHS repeat-associated protein